MLAEKLVDLLSEKVLATRRQLYGRPYYNNANLELEARLYSESKERTVTQGHWENLANSLKAMGKRSEDFTIQSISVKGYSDRVQLIKDSAGHVTVHKEVKYKIDPIDDDSGHWTRYSIAVEKLLSRLTFEYDETLAEVEESVYTTEVEKYTEEIVKRTKSIPMERSIKRTRYWIRDYVFVDMSVVTVDDKTHMEVEVELEGVQSKPERIQEFVTLCRKVLCLMRGTSYLYNRTVLETLATMVNMQLPAKTEVEPLENEVMRYHIDKAIFNTVRGLKKEDVVLKGIVGGSVHYSACYKTDGNRRILILSPLGIWLCWSPLIYNLIDPTLSATDYISVFDGELIPLSQRNDGSTEKYVFELFDCLMIESKDIRRFNHDQRLKLGSSVLYAAQRMNALPPSLKITYKKMHTITSPDQFFYVIKGLLENADVYRYKTDGLVFTPYNYHYWTGVEINNRDKTRTLVKTPEIVKWKPLELITTDFRYAMYEGEKRLLVAEVEEEEKNEYPFKGTLRYPFDQETMVDWQQLEDEGILLGSICEFSWTGGKYRFVKLRNDKQFPNTGTTVAESNWEEVQSPLTREAMTGDNFQFMFFYHNRIKSELMNNGSGTLLDLGSGRGGVVWRWGNYDKVIAVEPNESHREEFITRATKAGFRVITRGGKLPTTIKVDGVDKTERFVVLLDCKAEDTDIIKKEVFRVNPNGASAVSLIDVGTFLWQSDSVLAKSMETVKSCLSPGGVFLWKMMSGDRVRRIVSPLHNKGVRDGENTLEYGRFKLKYTVENDDVNKEVKIYIPEGITTEGDAEEGWQTEYLTSPEEMITKYFSDGYQEVWRKVANSEHFMSQNSIKLTNLYEYGVVKKEGSLIANVIASGKFATKGAIKETSSVRRVVKFG